MTAQYDAIADQYRRTKESPLRRYVEAYTFMELIGDVRDLNVLDLACGEGFYSRLLKSAGAKRVVGVDVSGEMIALARDRERDDPLGIEYVCADVGALDDSAGLGQFDLVTAAYLLHYAPDEAVLSRMCKNVFAHVAHGGRFVALNENPDQSPERFAGYEQYGFNKTLEPPLREGAGITYWMVSGREMFRIHAHWYSRATYECTLADAGFASYTWHPMRLDARGAAEHGEAYWREYLENPPIVSLECRA